MKKFFFLILIFSQLFSCFAGDSKRPGRSNWKDAAASAEASFSENSQIIGTGKFRTVKKTDDFLRNYSKHTSSESKITHIKKLFIFPTHALVEVQDSEEQITKYSFSSERDSEFSDGKILNDNRLFLLSLNNQVDFVQLVNAGPQVIHSIKDITAIQKTPRGDFFFLGDYKECNYPSLTKYDSNTDFRDESRTKKFTFNKKVTDYNKEVRKIEDIRTNQEGDIIVGLTLEDGNLVIATLNGEMEHTKTITTSQYKIDRNLLKIFMDIPQANQDATTEFLSSDKGLVEGQIGAFFGSSEGVLKNLYDIIDDQTRKRNYAALYVGSCVNNGRLVLAFMKNSQRVPSIKFFSCDQTNNFIEKEIGKFWLKSEDGKILIDSKIKPIYEKALLFMSKKLEKEYVDFFAFNLEEKNLNEMVQILEANNK